MGTRAEMKANGQVIEIGEMNDPTLPFSFLLLINTIKILLFKRSFGAIVSILC